LLAESRFLEKEIQSIKNDQLKQHYLERSQKVNAELSTRKDANEKPRERFPGIFSYNVGVKSVFYHIFISFSITLLTEDMLMLSQFPNPQLQFN